MIPLSPTLLAHQQGVARSPYLRAIARHARFGVALFPWTRYYSGSEPDSPHAATIAADGSLIRLRNHNGTLYLSRVSNPNAQSNFSTWASFGTAAPGTGVALAAHSTGEVLALFVTGSPPRTLTYRRSTDDGQSWSAPTAILAEAADIAWVALAFRESNGDACAFYTQSATLKRLRRTSGTWAGSGTAWTVGASVASLSGVATTHDGADYLLAITGTDTAGACRTWVSRLIDNGGLINVWGALVTVDQADPDATLSFHHPAITLSPELDPHAWYAAIESGDVPATRTFHVYPPHLSPGVAYPRWSFPEPHEASSGFGLALARDGDQSWATTPHGVWHASHPAQLDLTGRLIEATITLELTAASGRAILDNADGSLKPPSPPLSIGAQLELAPGYRSGAGGAPEFGATIHLEITRIDYGRKGTVDLTLAGPWELMARRTAPYALQVDAGVQSRALTAETLAARAGILLSAGGGAGWTTHTPAFALPPGGTVAGALRSLLDVADEVLIPSADVLQVRAPGDTVDYTYGLTPGHPITWFTRSASLPARNWTRTQGPGRYTDAADFASVYAHGASIAVVRSADATTNEKAQDYADAALGKAARPLTGTISVPVNAGAQLFDLISIDDDITRTTAEKFRILALRLEFTRARGKAPLYQHVFTLGAP